MLKHILPPTTAMPTPQDSGCRRWVFISYTHSDAAWADWLEQSLNAYELPEEIASRYAAPLVRKLGPVFRDLNSAKPGSSLPRILMEELDQSFALVVICSPGAAREESWVNQEIAYFKALERDERILPLVVAGQPGISLQGGRDAARGAECFPSNLLFRPVLNEHDRYVPSKTRDPIPLAADVSGHSPPAVSRKKRFLDEPEVVERERLKIICRLIEMASGQALDFNDFYSSEQRHKTELAQFEARKQRRRFQWAIGAVVMLMALAAATYLSMVRATRAEDRAKSSLAETEFTLSNADFRQAERLLGEKAPLDALAYLARAVRTNPGNWQAAHRLLSLLMQRNWGVRITDHFPGCEKVLHAAWSPSGDRLVTGDSDGLVRVWDVAAHKEVRGPLSVGPDANAYCVAFAPDGSKVAVGTLEKHAKGTARRGRVLLWDYAAGKVTAEIKMPETWVQWIAFSPDGNWLAVVMYHPPKDSSPGTLQSELTLWKMATRAQVGPPVPVKTFDMRPWNFDGRISFSPDSRELVVTGVPAQKSAGKSDANSLESLLGDNGGGMFAQQPAVFAVNDGFQQVVALHPVNSPEPATISPAGSYAATYDPVSRRLYCWDLKRKAGTSWGVRSPEWVGARHSADGMTLAHHPGGVEMAIACDDALYAFFPLQGNISEPMHLGRRITGLKMAQQGLKVATGMEDGSWRLAHLQNVEAGGCQFRSSGARSVMMWHPAFDFAVQLDPFEVMDLRPSRSLAVRIPGLTGSDRTQAATADGHVITADVMGKMADWGPSGTVPTAEKWMKNVMPEDEQQSQKDFEEDLRALKDNAGGGNKGVLGLVERLGGRQRRKVVGFSTDGSTVLVSAPRDHTVSLEETLTHRKIWTVKGGDPVAHSISNEGRYVFMMSGGKPGVPPLAVLLENDKTSSGKIVSLPGFEPSTCRNGEVSLDGKYFASSGKEGELRVWRLADQRLLVEEDYFHNRKPGNEGIPAEVSTGFQRDGVRHFVGGSAFFCSMARTYVFWNLADPAKKPLVCQYGRPDSVVYAAPHPTRLLVALASNTGQVTLLDGTDGKMARSFTTGLGTIRRAVWFPDGRRLAVMNTEGSFAVFDSETGSALTDVIAHKGADDVLIPADGSHLITCPTADYAGGFTAKKEDAEDIVRVTLLPPFPADKMSRADAETLASLAEAVCGVRLTPTGAQEPSSRTVNRAAGTTAGMGRFVDWFMDRGAQRKIAPQSAGTVAEAAMFARERCLHEMTSDRMRPEVVAGLFAEHPKDLMIVGCIASIISGDARLGIDPQAQAKVKGSQAMARRSAGIAASLIAWLEQQHDGDARTPKLLALLRERLQIVQRQVDAMNAQAELDLAAGTLSLSLGDGGAAWDSLQKVLASNPDQWKAYLYSALLSEALGNDVEKTMPLFKKAMEMDPDLVATVDLDPAFPRSLRSALLKLREAAAEQAQREMLQTSESPSSPSGAALGK